MDTVSTGVSKLLRNVAVCAAMALGLVFCASPALATEKMSAADRSNLAKALGFIKAADGGDRTLAESYLATNVRWWVAGIGVMDKHRLRRRLTSTRPTAAPAFARARATPLPMPCAAPVTMATLPSSDFMRFSPSMGDDV
jgi:hypothetical protein